MIYCECGHIKLDHSFGTKLYCSNIGCDCKSFRPVPDSDKLDTLLDYIRREAAQKVVDTRRQECGCVFNTFENGSVTLEHCSQHPHKPDIPPDELRNMTHRQFEEKYLGYDTRDSDKGADEQKVSEGEGEI